MNDRQNLLCYAFAIISFLIAVVLMMIYGWSLLLTFAGIILLLNAYIMGLRLKLDDARHPPPEPSDVSNSKPPLVESPADKAVSETRDVLDHLIADNGHREVMADDVARLAEECGHHEFAQKLRAAF